MIFSKKILITLLMIFGLNLSFVSADESAELVVEGQQILTRTKAPSHMENIDEVRSGWTFRIKKRKHYKWMTLKIQE